MSPSRASNAFRSPLVAGPGRVDGSLRDHRRHMRARSVPAGEILQIVLGQPRRRKPRCLRFQNATHLMQFDQDVVAGRRQGELEEPPSLRDPLGQHEVDRQGAEPAGDRTVGRVGGIRERRSKVVVLELEAAPPAQPVRPAQLVAPLIRKRREVLRTVAANAVELACPTMTSGAAVRPRG